jgi:hypothetical protein
MFKFLWSLCLFGVGLVAVREWHDAVLQHYSMRCTLLPDPAPYPLQLVRLANGHLTIKGIRELLVCDSEPLYGVSTLLH